MAREKDGALTRLTLAGALMRDVRILRRNKHPHHGRGDRERRGPRHEGQITFAIRLFRFRRRCLGHALGRDNYASDDR